MRAAFLALCVVACGGDPGPVEVDVMIDSGPIHGLDQKGVRKFLGIPFAASPIGANRWRPPQPVEPWSDVRDMIYPGEMCPQINPFGLPGGVEDCLFLNVFAPRETPTKAPVMVWIHGGGFVFGSGSEMYYDGQVLAKRGVIVVTINYRLGAFGSFAHPALPGEGTGNFGLQDQLAALQWVQRNIAVFGGDPANVTIFGESAGGLSVCAHYLSPTTHDLFARAISESGLCTAGFERTQAQAVADSMTMAQSLGCTTGDVAACLRSKTVMELTAAITPPPTASQPPGGLLYLSTFINPAPFVDGKTIVDMRAAFAAGNFEPRPLLLGTNRDEGTMFHSAILANPVTSESEYRNALQRRYGNNANSIVAQYPAASFPSPNRALAEVTGDAQFVCPARRAARAATMKGAPVFRYTFEHELTNPTITDGGVIHSAEIPFVFGNDTFLLGSIAGADDMVETMQRYWTNFAKTGDPNSTGLTAWPKYELVRDDMLTLNTPVSPASNFKQQLCDFWDQLN